LLAYGRNVNNSGDLKYTTLKDIIDNKINGVVKENSSLISAFSCDDENPWRGMIHFSIISNISKDVLSVKEDYSLNGSKYTESQIAVANKVFESVFERLELAKRIEQTNPINERNKEFYIKYIQEKIDKSTFLYNVNKEKSLLIMAGKLDGESSLHGLPLKAIQRINSHFLRLG
jgi:hypothetical protein